MPPFLFGDFLGRLGGGGFFSSGFPNLPVWGNIDWPKTRFYLPQPLAFMPLPDKNGLLTKYTEVHLQNAFKSFCNALPLPNFFTQNKILQPNYALCLRNWIKLI
ncbi:MAG: hypothetical protein ACKVUS_08585 [Saprospiraceae bacterium]